MHCSGLWKIACVACLALPASAQTAATAFATARPELAGPIAAGCRAPLPADATVPDRTALNSGFAAQRLALWQNRLNLQTWQITLAMTRRSDLKPGTLGAIRWDHSRKTATLWVLDTSETEAPSCQTLANLEFTIVHELVHLELAGLPRKEATAQAEEDAVNQLARALLRVDRREP